MWWHALGVALCVELHVENVGVQAVLALGSVWNRLYVLRRIVIVFSLVLGLVFDSFPAVIGLCCSSWFDCGVWHLPFIVELS